MTVKTARDCTTDELEKHLEALKGVDNAGMRYPNLTHVIDQTILDIKEELALRALDGTAYKYRPRES